MTYQVGEIVPLDYARNIIGARLPKPEWYGLLVPPQKERATSLALKAKGVHSCFPEREKRWRSRGKAIARKFPVVSQIVYAKFERQPQWDVLKYRRLICGVFSYGDRPIVLHGDIIRAVMGLPTVAEEVEAARREMLRVRDGDKARIADGPLEGFLVDVCKVRQGRVWFETLTGLKGEACVSKLERITTD